MNLSNIASWILVGVLWGCTNPLLRKGSTETNTKTTNAPDLQQQHGTEDNNNNNNNNNNNKTLWSQIAKALSKFRYMGVWLPYLLNQSGSILYYKVLAETDLTLAVPICNSLTLLFSIITSIILGERVDKPVQAMIGSALVMVGVGLCVSNKDDAADTTTTGNSEL
jgi:drug/metabolite transporter (DMT)-like permease